MRNKNRIIILLIFALALGLMAAGETVADETGAKIFVDLDGDGIGDNESDKNGNSIPDCFEGAAIADEEDGGAVRSILGNVFNSDLAFTSSEDLRTNTDKFGSLAFKIRGLPQRCHGFGTEDEFGGGSGLGLSSGSGGCVGGVCVR